MHCGGLNHCDVLATQGWVKSVEAHPVGLVGGILVVNNPDIPHMFHLYLSVDTDSHISFLRVFQNVHLGKMGLEKDLVVVEDTTCIKSSF